MLINISRVCKSFGSAEVLKNVTFQLDRGDRVGVVGENGTGKTTLLNIVSGILPPDDGVVAVKRGLRVGYVEQLAPAPEAISVREYVRLGDERIVEMEERLQAIEDYRERYNLSNPCAIDRKWIRISWPNSYNAPI